MRGSFYFKTKDIDESNCSLKEIICMLNNIHEVEAKPATKTDRDFFDFVRAIYYDTIIESFAQDEKGEPTDSAQLAKVELYLFEKRIVKTFTDASNFKKIKRYWCNGCRFCITK